MRLTSDHIHAQPVIVKVVGSIHLPESVTRLQNYSLWTVLQTGPGRVTRKGVRIPVECTPGDRLVTQFHHSGPKLLPDGTAILSQDQVLAVISP